MAVVALKKQALHCRLPNDWLLFLSIDLATFCDTVPLIYNFTFTCVYTQGDTTQVL